MEEKTITKEEFEKWEKDFTKRIEAMPLGYQRNNAIALLKEVKFSFSIGRKMSFQTFYPSLQPPNSALGGK